MHALGKSQSAKLSVRAPAMARRWARVRPHRLSVLLGGDDPENRLVEEIPAEGFGGRRHAVHVLCLWGPALVEVWLETDDQEFAGYEQGSQGVAAASGTIISYQIPPDIINAHTVQRLAHDTADHLPWI
jgi:hypothetical protein